jgi:hypothetical protein
MSELFSQDEVRKALSAMLEPGAVFEVRAVEAKLAGSYRPGTISGYFDSIDACIAALKKLVSADGVYVTMNPVDPALLARRHNRLDNVGKTATTGDQHILGRRWLLFDVDFKRASGISTADAEKEITKKKTREIYAYLKDRGWPLPIVADSGNAYHLNYRIELSREDDGLVEKVLDALAGRFDGEGVELDRGVHNPSRIIKLYGSLVCKGDNTKERPWRLSKILDAPESLQVVSVEQLRSLVDELLPKEPGKPKGSNSRSAGGNGKPNKAEVREMLAKIPKRPDYHDWIKLVAAVGDALPDEEAIEVLNEWSAEESPGEYAKKLQSGFSEIGVGTLIHLAQKHGWTGRTQASQTVDLHAGAVREPVELPPPPPPYVPPPLTLLPSVLQDYVHAAAESLNVDVSYILLPKLSSLGTAIGNSRSILLKRGFVQPPVIWTGIIGRSGSRKSPALDAGCKGVMEKEHELIRQNKQVEEEDAEALAIWETADKKKRGVKPAARDPITCIMDKLTFEVLADKIEANRRGVLIKKDELVHWFESFDQYHAAKGSDVGQWLSLHTGVLFAFDRRSDKRSYRIWQPRVNISGGIQLKVFRRILTPDYFERGLPARFLFSHPPFRPDYWSEATISDAIQKAALELFEELWFLQPEGSVCDTRPRLLSLDKHAKALFVDFYNECGTASVEASEQEEAAWSKLTGYAARLALVGQLARDPHAETITEGTMAAACELTRWFGNEAVRIYAELAETPEQLARRDLIEFVVRRGGAVYERDVMQSFTRLKNNKAGTERELTALVNAGLGKWEPVPTTEKGGRPARKFFYLGASTSTQPAKLPSVATGSVDVDSPNSQKNEAPNGLVVAQQSDGQVTPAKLEL